MRPSTHWDEGPTEELILAYQYFPGDHGRLPYATQQKLTLTRLITRAERPLTPAEICRAGKRRIPSLGIATVYRALKQLVAEGQVRVVEVPGASPHYECTARRHHHFFFCQHCRHLYNLQGCVRGVGGLAPKGFSVKRHEIVLYGECTDCRGRAGSAARHTQGRPKP
jgi:Fur family transcriptional regulator, ferric uptake regulator